MINNKKIIITSFLLTALCNCFGMELPKSPDQFFINGTEPSFQNTVLFNDLIKELPNDEELEASFNDVGDLTNDNNQLIDDAQRAALFNAIGSDLPEDIELEAAFNDIDGLAHDQDLSQKIEEVLLNDEEKNLINSNTELTQKTNLSTRSNKRQYAPDDEENDPSTNKKHKSNILKKYQCDQCEYSCDRNPKLIIHKRTHTGEKPYQCEQCELSFTQKSNLTTHMRTHTNEESSFKCDECDATYKRKESLKIHKRTHTNEKPYKCDQCDYACIKNYLLKVHLLTHTGEKPFKCDQCDFSFAQRSSLQRHQLTHTGEKPFQCNQCDYSCTTSTDLKKHKQRMHK